jgi:hypothetical protein
MSSIGGFDLIIYSIVGLIKTINDLRLAYQDLQDLRFYQKEQKMTTTDGKIYNNVEVIVKDENNRSIGFQKQKDGSYRIIADNYGLNPEQIKKQKEFINKIKRRYAYNMLIQELKKQGYEIYEEKKLEKDVVKLIARKWIA